MNSGETKIELRELTMAYGSYIVMRDINARIRRGSIFVIMGQSGSGKSTLLRNMIGLQAPAEGEVLYDGLSFWGLDDETRRVQLRKFGVLFQSGALWSSMTLAENVNLPLSLYTDWTRTQREEVARLKLALVGLSGFEDHYPAEISGGMRTRAGLARAMALDPEILFFDEPSAGLDPIISRNMDELILELRDGLGATIVVVSHELASIFTIADDSIFLDAESKTMRGQGNPRELRDHSPDPKIRAFLTRGRIRFGGGESMKKVNATALGLFVVLGVMLGVFAIFLFSSRGRFHPKERSILYFDGSLKGLNPGAPVKFRGVTIGKVEQILIRHNQTSNDYAMPVIIAIDKTVAQSKSDRNLEIGSQEELERLIGHGFRGRLDAESLVTGVLYVSLDILDNPVPPEFHQVTPEYHEIPTAPSGVQRFLESLERVDLPGISAKLNMLLSQLDVPRINAGITNVLGAAHQLITTPDLTNAITAAKVTLERAQALLNRIDNRVDPLADSLTGTLSDAQKTLADLRRALQNVSRLIGPNSSIGPDLSQALEELSNASRAVADLAEFLKRNPDALLTGRKPSKE